MIQFEEHKTYVFKVVADSKEEALRLLNEEFKAPLKPAVKTLEKDSIPNELLELKINTLVEDMAKRGRKEAGTITATIDKWLGIKYEPESYPQIVDKLTELKENDEKAAQ